jgi:hypothetical protein
MLQLVPDFFVETRRPGATRISCLCDRRRRKVISFEGSSSRTAERALEHRVQISPAYCTASAWSSELQRRAGRTRERLLSRGLAKAHTHTIYMARVHATSCTHGDDAGDEAHARTRMHTPSDGNAISIDNEVAQKPRVCPQLFHGLLNLRLQKRCAEHTRSCLDQGSRGSWARVRVGQQSLR